MKTKIQFAKTLRQSMTDAEHCLWKHLRAHRLRGAKFKRQQALGPYVVDFVCFEANLVIEVDGGQHQESETDRTRDAWLRRQGFFVLRFWNNEALKQTAAVLEKIAEHLPPLPNPSPAKGRGAKTPPLQNAPSSPAENGGKTPLVQSVSSPTGGRGAKRPSIQHVPSPLAGEGQGEGESMHNTPTAKHATQRLQ